MYESLVCLCRCHAQKTFAQVERRIFTYDEMMKQQRCVIDDVCRSALLESAKKVSSSEARLPRSSLRIVEDHPILIPNRCEQTTEVEDY